MLAIMVVLTTLEAMLPPLPFMPHVKPGLANIVTMYAVFSVGYKQAVTLNALKSLFVFLLRGALAGLLSFAGGMLSILIIILLVKGFDKEGRKISYAAVGVAGAVAHNYGQFAVALILINVWQTAVPFTLTYLPILTVSGVAMGTLTGSLLRVVMPALRPIR
jgi:heptaprenyl diphosphate synthase